MSIHHSFLADPATSMKVLLRQMTDNHCGVMFIVDESFRLLGAVSDGDIRRALLQDLSVEAPAENFINLNPVSAPSREVALELLKDPRYLAIPVVKQGVVEEIAWNQAGNISFISTTKEDAAPGNKKQVKILALIPARGGSKRIPRKNLARIGEHSLLAHAILCAKQCAGIDRVWVSTEDEEIAQEASRYGAETNWKRPAELAGDKAKSIDVVIHAFRQFEKEEGYLPEWGLLLEPTAPTRTPALLSKALEVFRNTDADSLVSINEVPHNYHPEEILLQENGLIRPYMPERTMDTRKLRGDQQPVYVQNGLVYLFRVKMLLEKQSLYGNKVLALETDPELFVDIDTPADLKLAQFKLREYAG